MYLKIECVYFMNCRKKILSFAFFMNIAAQCFFGKLKKRADIAEDDDNDDSEVVVMVVMVVST